MKKLLIFTTLSLCPLLTHAGSQTYLTPATQNGVTPDVQFSSASGTNYAPPPPTEEAKAAHVAPLPLTEAETQQLALQQTQNVLIDPSKRIEVIKGNPNAQKMDSNVNELMGAHSDDMYKAAADFLPYILKMGQGDPQKMMDFLKQASRDPASFAKNLPPDLQKKITDLSQKAKPLPEERKP